jgi:ankyrin repeat protein
MKGNVKMIEMLIDAGAKINGMTNEGETAVHLAALKGNLKAVKTPANRGAKLRMRNKNGETPENLARAFGHEEVAEFLEGRMEEDMNY